MTRPAERNSSSRRAKLSRARQSRRPSRLGTAAGVAAEPDYLLSTDAGFPGLLKRVWRAATAAEDLPAAVDMLLTLGGHVPADVQLRALGSADEIALWALSGVSWRADWAAGADGAEGADRAGGGAAVFVGELGLCTNGRVAVRVPSRGPLATEVDLVDGVLHVPWTAQALADYQAAVVRAATRRAGAIADCRAWLAAAGPGGRADLLEQLKDAAQRTAPFVLYQDRKQYTNFRDRNTITGKTLWPGHPDCALSGLQALPLELWSDNDAELVVCLALLVRSAGYARIEEANGTQLTLDHVAYLLERTRQAYSGVPGEPRIPPAASTGVAGLNDLAERLRARRPGLGRTVQLYREIHGALMHKVERVAGPPGPGAERREADLCARLRERLPVSGRTLHELGASVAAAPGWLARPHGGFGTGLESLVHATVVAANAVFEADFAMSRGMRSLPRLVRALRAQDWSQIAQWDLPEYFCCVVPAEPARRYFGDSVEQLADIAWAISARMQYNSWHFIAGNLPKVADVVARDYFVPPTIPDLAYHSDQHHHGHVAARVRWSIRSPQPVTVLDRTFTGFIDLRLLRCEGPRFDEQDLLAARRGSAFIAGATSAAAALVAAGTDIEITSFDPDWHWATIAAPESPTLPATPAVGS
ncbi:MAG: hypothetical protein V7637_178 [Mycobacteriales bacterium]